MIVITIVITIMIVIAVLSCLFWALYQSWKSLMCCEQVLESTPAAATVAAAGSAPATTTTSTSSSSITITTSVTKEIHRKCETVYRKMYTELHLFMEQIICLSFAPPQQFQARKRGRRLKEKLLLSVQCCLEIVEVPWRKGNSADKLHVYNHPSPSLLSSVPLCCVRHVYTNPRRDCITSIENSICLLHRFCEIVVRVCV